MVSRTSKPFLYPYAPRSVFKFLLGAVILILTAFSVHIETVSVVDAASGASVFANNLKLGDQNPDVTRLQQVLNADPDTQVAASGPGSKGQETAYFGPATRNAVVRFQNKYAADILIPDQLSAGNGFVGQLTRAKLNALFSGTSAAFSSGGPAATSTSSTLPDPTVSNLTGLFKGDTSKLFVVSSSARVGVYGSTLNIYGSGFADSGNTVHFGDDHSVQNVAGVQHVKLSFSIPQNIPLGNYPIWVSNSAGVSNKNLFFVIINTGTKAPSINSISPQSGAVGTVVTISGSGFSPANNEVMTPYGIIPNLSSADGKTIQFTFSYPNFVALQQLKDQGKSVGDLSLPVPIGVVDDNGMTAQQVQFTVLIRKSD